MKTQRLRQFNCTKYPEEVQLTVICCKLCFSLTFNKFAKDNEFSTEQTSAWFSIIKSVHEMTVGKFTILFCCIIFYILIWIFSTSGGDYCLIHYNEKGGFFQYIPIKIKVISLLLIKSCSNTIIKHKIQCFIWYSQHHKTLTLRWLDISWNTEWSVLI